jgi:metallo-beta-lactamase family protein
MILQFCGAAQTVTGAQILLGVNGRKILLECGLFQGRRQESYDRNQKFLFDPSTLDTVILSHAHIDHSGNIPNLVKHGYKGSIYATPATVDLCKIMLRDSAYLQMKDVEWVNKRRRNSHLPAIKPLYTLADVEASLDAFAGIDYDRPFSIAPGVEAMFREAGHILGSAGIHLEIKEGERIYRLGFSGDIGRPDMPMTRDPNVLRELDILIMESTYGNRLHSSYADVEEELAEAVRKTAAGGGKVIIPSFAVGRTQHLVYVFHKLFDENRIPDMPIYVDSPLACDATDIFKKYPQYLDREAKRIFLVNNETPFEFPRLTYVHTVEESKKLNDLKFPHVIISGSGMCEGGRILHHLRNNVEDPRNLVIFVGYAAKETLARKIMDGRKTVKIFGEEHAVKCSVKLMDAFSAHADHRDLIHYIDLNSPKRLKHLFLIHGEPEQAIPLRDAFRSKGFENVHYPSPGETFTFDKETP